MLVVVLLWPMNVDLASLEAPVEFVRVGRDLIFVSKPTIIEVRVVFGLCQKLIITISLCFLCVCVNLVPVEKSNSCSREELFFLQK